MLIISVLPVDKRVSLSGASNGGNAPPGPLRGGHCPPLRICPWCPPWKLKDQRILIYLTSMAKILYTPLSVGANSVLRRGQKNFARARAFRNISFHFAPPWRNLVGRPWMKTGNWFSVLSISTNNSIQKWVSAQILIKIGWKMWKLFEFFKRSDFSHPASVARRS